MPRDINTGHRVFEDFDPRDAFDAEAGCDFGTEVANVALRRDRGDDEFKPSRRRMRRWLELLEAIEGHA